MNPLITTKPSIAELFQRDFELTAILERILASCELPTELSDKARQHYNEKTKHLKKCPLLSNYEVVIKPQGSMSIGTTVPPVSSKKKRKAGEFDVDLLIAIEAKENQMVPQNLLREIGAYLKLEYAKDLTPIRYGWQLDYAIEDRMHFDIVPAVRSFHEQKGMILAAPDRDKNEWKATNPEGYTKDFLALCEQLPLFERELVQCSNSAHGTLRKEAREPKVEKLPEPSPMKRPLQRVVQLTKRHRDTWFSKLPNDGLKRRPASIVVTTILWYAYQRYVANRQFASVYAIVIKLAESLTDSSILLRKEEGRKIRYDLPNPTLPDENLVAKWNLDENQQAVAEFFTWAEDYRKFIIALSQAEGRHVLQEKLSSCLGQDHVLPVFKADALAAAPGNAARSNLAYVPKLGITGLATIATALPLKAHTFHGIH